MSGAILVGLCGRSGAGKGYVSEIFFRRFGIPSIDTDAVYRDLTKPCGDNEVSECMRELKKRFGDNVAAPDNSLNREVMRSLVFGDNKENLRDLNRITHKHILAETEKTADRLYKKGYKIILIDAPLLFESGFDKLCRRTVCVTTDEATALRRIMRRDGIDEDSAKKRLAVQIPADELEKKCDFVIVNDCGGEELEARVGETAARLRELCVEPEEK